MLTRKLIFWLAAVLTWLPRFMWLPVIGIVRTTNNYLYGVEQSVRAMMALGFHRNPAALVFGLTNFPHGVSSHGAPVIDIGIFSPFGAVYFTDSGHGNKNDNNAATRPDAPTATIDAAHDKATASQGDVVMVAAGHAEDIASVTSLVLDLTGVTVIGLGRGPDRPTLTMTATDAEIIVSAAGAALVNFLIVVTEAGTIDVVVALTASAEVLLKDLEFRQTAADAEFVDTIILASGADRAHLEGLIFDSVTNGGAQQSCVNIPSALEGVQITDFYANGAFVSGAIQNETAGMLNARLRNITVRQLHASQDACIAMHADATGFIDGARLRTVGTDDLGITGAIVAAKFQLYNVGIVNADGEHGATEEMESLDISTSRSGKTFSSIA